MEFASDLNAEVVRPWAGTELPILTHGKLLFPFA